MTKDVQIVSASTSRSRSLLASTMLALSLSAGMQKPTVDPDMNFVKYGPGRFKTSGQGVPGAAKARAKRKVKKKMRQQSRKKK